MSDQAEKYDAIIIGAGQAGVPLSKALAEAGGKTALIERKHIGGTCVNEGCTPTKTLIGSARVAYLARRTADFGIEPKRVRIDMHAVRQRKRNVVESFMLSSLESLKATENLDLIFGHARFSDQKTVEVFLPDGSSRWLEADVIVIDTGGRPLIPPIHGLDAIPHFDSTSILEIDEVPEHLIVLGGGYVACEFAQLFHRLGANVTIVERGPHLLAREDRDVAKAVVDVLRGEGVRVLLSSEITDVAHIPNGVRCAISSAGADVQIEGSHVLVAAGRIPNTDGLDLENTGLTANERGYIPVNDRLETGVAGVYAVGDVNGGPAFTHVSYDDFRILKKNLLDGGSASTAGRLVPYTVFLDPQLGRIGIGEEEAKRLNLDVHIARLDMTSVARAIETGETRGFMKAVVDAKTGQILGCAVLGIDGGEIMSMIEIAIMGKLPYTALRDGIFAHPTLAESVNNLFSTI